jgi:hypothetical protein
MTGFPTRMTLPCRSRITGRNRHRENVRSSSIGNSNPCEKSTRLFGCRFPVRNVSSSTLAMTSGVPPPLPFISSTSAIATNH